MFWRNVSTKQQYISVHVKQFLVKLSDNVLKLTFDVLKIADGFFLLFLVLSTIFLLAFFHAWRVSSQVQRKKHNYINVVDKPKEVTNVSQRQIKEHLRRYDKNFESSNLDTIPSTFHDKNES